MNTKDNTEYIWMESLEEINNKKELGTATEQKSERNIKFQFFFSFLILITENI